MSKIKLSINDRHALKEGVNDFVTTVRKHKSVANEEGVIRFQNMRDVINGRPRT